MMGPLRLGFGLVIALSYIGGNSGMQIECMHGWMGFGESTSCYKFMQRSRNFDEASSMCQFHGGHLAYINSQKEHDWITLNIGKLSGMDKNKAWWMGLRFNEQAAHYQWLDGTDVDQTIVKWAPGAPGDSKECGKIDQRGFLKNAPCVAEVHAYVCERPIGAPLPCAPGWELHRESCYKIYQDKKMKYEEARAECRGLDSDLVVIQTADENTALKAFMPDKPFWIGMREENGKFMWVNGVENGGPGVLANWQSGQPIGGQNEKAAYMTKTDDDKWSTRPYYESIHFICEKPKGSFCQFDLVSYGSSCYDFQVGNSYTWHDWTSSEKICTDIGLKLAVIEDQNENDFLLQHAFKSLGLNEVGLWLGYIETEPNSKKFKRITDGKMVGDEGVYSNFMEHLDFLDSQLEAAFMHVNEDAASKGKWGVMPDTKQDAIVVCEVPKGTTIDVSGIMHPKEKCPSDEWSAVFGSYCYLNVITGKTWAESRTHCKAVYQEADLVSIQSVYENDFVHELARKISDHVWIGFSDRFSEGQWTWSDGSPNSFTEWNSGEPNGGTRENCAEIINGGWNDIACDTRMGFICKTKAIPDGDPILPETTTLPPFPNCGSLRGWVEDTVSGICYYKIQGSLKWSDAYEECRHMDVQTNLVSINSAQEQTFLNHWLGGNQRYWMGINTLLNARASYAWSDFSPVSFVNWQDNEPNNPDTEKCGDFNTGVGGRWNDANCETYLTPICEKKGKNYVEPFPPDIKPKPKCAEGWEPLLDRCYFFSSISSKPAYNWTEANSFCKSIHRAATLVSIKDLAEQQLIQGKLSGPTFIGGTDVDVEGKWTWVDGSAWSYENWAPGEPNGQKNENCLEMLQNGQWNDIGCQTERIQHFICSYENVVCPEYWTYFDGSCWFLPPDYQGSFTSAEAICSSENPKAHLASIHSDVDNYYVVQNMLANEITIGLRYIDDIEKWVWMDRSPLDYTSWDFNEPMDPTNKRCVRIDQRGKWKTYDCEQSYKFACRLIPTHYMACPMGWEKYFGYCYYIQTKLMNYQDAEKSCKLGGGQLASLINYGESHFVTSAIHYHSHQRCPDQWLYDELYKKCYMVSDYQETWTKSVEKCQEFGANLLHIDSVKKGQRIVDLGVDVVDFWIDASDYNSEGHWTWESDSKQLTYFNWAAGEPNGGTSENCIMVYLKTQYMLPLTWNDEHDETPHSFICEMDQNEYEHQDEIMAWIGLNDLKHSQTFEWIDDMHVFETEWGPSLPTKHLGETDKSCTQISAKDDYWYHGNCDDKKISVCKARQEITDIKPTSYGCSEGELEYEASCFQFRMAKEDFATANRMCAAGSAGHLVTFNNKFEEDIVIAQLATVQSKEFYIGMKYDVQDRKFYWVNGDVVLHTNWGDKQPDVAIDDQGQGLCVYLKNEAPFGWRWFVSKCDEKRDYICEHLRNGYTTEAPPPTTTTKEPLKCYPDWSLVSNRCFRHVDQPLIFDEARRYCKGKDADLATFESLEQEKAVMSAIGKESSLLFGLMVFEDTGLFWVDESPVTYVNWMEGETTDYHCAMVIATQDDSTAWINRECSLPEKFICEMQAFEVLPPTTPAPTLGPDVPCHEGQQDGWIRRPNSDVFCYKFVHPHNQTNWHNAELACQKEEAHLVSIHSEAENNFISMKLSNQGGSSWIGLNALEMEEYFVWTDGSSLMYENWADYEPSFSDSLESCIEMYTGTYEPGRWNDAMCNKQTTSFVCKKPRDGGWTTPVPTLVPAGHCPEGYYEFKGHCYIVHGGPGSTFGPEAWLYARDICKSLGVNHDLASVHSIHESAFLANMVLSSISDHVQDVWIGLHVPSIHDSFVWSDQSGVDYDFWAPKQPGSHPESYTYCAAMLGNNDRYFGRWEDLGCENPMPYICQTKVSSFYPSPPVVKKCSDPHGDFVNFYGNCFLFVPEKKTWEQAEADCQRRSAHLASVVDMPSQYFLMNEITSSQAWIGLSNTKDHNKYEWSDNFGVHMTNWNGQPQPSTDDICASMNSANGKWYPNACNSEMEYVCKFTNKPDPGPDMSGDCPEGYQTYGILAPYCYRLFESGSGGKTWYEANQHCIQEGGHLASIHSEHTNAVILRLAKRISHDVFIGLTAVDEQGNFTWTDGSAMDFLNWDTEEYYEPEDSSCVYLDYLKGTWVRISCSYDYSLLATICQVPKTEVPSTTAKPSTTSNTTAGPTPTPVSTSTSSTTSTTSGSTQTTTTQLVITPQGDGLSSGSVAAIVIMTLLLIGALIGGVIYWKRKDMQLRQMFAHTPLRTFGRSSGISNPTHPNIL